MVPANIRLTARTEVRCTGVYRVHRLWRWCPTCPVSLPDPIVRGLLRKAPYAPPGPLPLWRKASTTLLLGAATLSQTSMKFFLHGYGSQHIGI